MSGVIGMTIEHAPGNNEVIVRLECASAYEASILYVTLSENADRGGLTIDFEGTKNLKDVT